jgi:hypothetical protein
MWAEVDTSEDDGMDMNQLGAKLEAMMASTAPKQATRRRTKAAA